MKPIIELKDILTPDKKILITTHHKPDADALGSSLGLYNYLKQKNFENVVVITPTDYGAFLNWMPGNDTVIIYEQKTELSKSYIADADIIFCLDFNALKRINEMGHDVAASKAIKVMIDHHLQPEPFDDYRLHDTKACSTCELIYTFINTMGDDTLLNKDIAECLYAGILTDTGNFRHDTTTGNTHRIVARLLDCGVKSDQVQSHIYDNFTLRRTQLIGYTLAHKLEYIPELNTSLMVLDRNEIKHYGVLTGDTEGLVNWGLTITGVKLGVLIIDRKVKVKMSFRGKGDFPCNEFARKYFNGGGHFNAAGGESDEPLEVVVEKFKEYIKEYKDILKTKSN